MKQIRPTSSAFLLGLVAFQTVLLMALIYLIGAQAARRDEEMDELVRRNLEISVANQILAEQMFYYQKRAEDRHNIF